MLFLKLKFCRVCLGKNQSWFQSLSTGCKVSIVDGVWYFLRYCDIGPQSRLLRKWTISFTSFSNRWFMQSGSCYTYVLCHIMPVLITFAVVSC